MLTHWGRVTHICVSKLTIIGSDNGLSPGRRQAIIWTNAGILSIGPLGTNFSEILIGIQTFSFRKMHLKISSGKWRPSCLGLNAERALIKSVRRASTTLNTLRPKQNHWHFADDTFKCVFLNENIRTSINISLKFVPGVQLTIFHHWRRPGDNPLSEPMMVSILTHICVTRSQWVKRVLIMKELIDVLRAIFDRH